MAKHNRYIPVDIRRFLVFEAGEKCANPGCTTRFVEYHHIEQWAVYQDHKKEHMIALCPTCHYHAEHGILKIPDVTLYLWKGSVKKKLSQGQIYVEPSDRIKIVLGSIALMSETDIGVCDFSEQCKISFKVVDDDICLLDLSIASISGQNLIKLVSNTVKYDHAVEYNQRPGKINAKIPLIEGILPAWLFSIVKQFNGNGGDITLLDVEVIRPGVVKLEGIWFNDLMAFYVTKDKFHIINRGEDVRTLVGDGEDSVIGAYKGNLGTAFFKIEDKETGS